MRLRVLVPFAVAISACSIAPRSHATAAKAATPATVAACANPALPALIVGSPGTNAIGPVQDDPQLPIATVAAPKASLSLAVANDDVSRELGLMCVLRLDPHAGMIFVFDKDAKQEFWMKNTLMALDMVWVRADGTVDTVAANVPKSTLAMPDDAVARRAGFGKYVIELAAGEAAADGIGVGSDLKIAPK